MKLIASVAALALSSVSVASAADYRVEIPRYMFDSPAGLEAAAARIDAAALAVCEDANMRAPGARAAAAGCFSEVREEIASRIGEPRLTAHLSANASRLATN